MSSTNATTIAANTTTNATLTTPAPTESFCFTCGFDFGHIIDGVDDRTAGALMVVLFLMLMLGAAIIIACVMHNWCCGEGQYHHLAQRAEADKSGEDTAAGDTANTKA